MMIEICLIYICVGLTIGLIMKAWQLTRKNKMEVKKLICFLDGDCLCIVNKDFVNLQESPGVFVNLTKKQLKEINK